MKRFVNLQTNVTTTGLNLQAMAQVPHHATQKGVYY